MFTFSIVPDKSGKERILLIVGREKTDCMIVFNFTTKDHAAISII